MEKVLLKIACFLVFAKSALVLDYRFGSNFGKFFHDFEPNDGSLDAINGYELNNCNNCTRPTDRGAYFTSSTYNIITLPIDRINAPQLKLSSSFVIAMWLLPDCRQPGQILYREFAYSFLSFNFEINYSCDSKIYLNLNLVGMSSTLTGNEFHNRNLYSEIWSFLTVKIEGTKFRFYIYDLLQGEFDMYTPYDESNKIIQGFYLGNTYDGFIWDFKLFDSPISNSHYFGGLYFPGRCLTPACPVSCPTSVIKNNLQFCLSDIIDPNQSSQGQDCESSCIYGCANSMCLDCPCTTITCEVYTTQQISIYCPNSLSSFANLCSHGRFYDGTSCVCNSECKICTGPTTCMTCVDPNAVPDTYLCKCNTGYYKDTSTEIAICTPCNPECLTCDNPLSCLICKQGDNRLLGDFEGCNCADGYYKAYAQYFTKCSPCPDHCLTCSMFERCDKCKPLNSHLTLTGDCVCDSGYTKTTQLTSSWSCTKCNVECYECYQNSTCSSCVMLNALPAEVGCKCIQGYYKNISQQRVSCFRCHQDCLECEEALRCTTCTDNYKKPSTDQGCVCIDGYYSQENGQCAQCPQDCITCKDHLHCVLCIVASANPNNQSSCECPFNSLKFGSMCLCNPGFYIDSAFSGYFCRPCEKNCKTCINKFQCASCINNLQLSKNNTCETCAPQMYLSNDSCLNCPSLCESCSKTECFTCVRNASNSKNCTCDEGFFQDDSQCRRLYFNASAFIFQNNTIELIFTDSPRIRLTKDNFKVVIVPTVLFSFETYQKSSQSYLIVILLGESVNDMNRISISITTEAPLTSEKNYLYTNQSLSLRLYKDNKYQFHNLTDKISNQTKLVIRYALGAAISAGLLNNPSTTWILMNKIQLLSYIPLSSIELTPSLSRFFKSMGTNEVVQNPLTWGPLQEALQFPPSSEPYLEARKYGIKTDSFIVNSGVFIACFCIFISLIPIVWFMTKIKNDSIKKYAEKWLKSYKYSFFLRFYMQSYLDITIFAIIQIRALGSEQFSDNWFSILGSSFSVLVVVRHK